MSQLRELIRSEPSRAPRLALTADQLSVLSGCVSSFDARLEKRARIILSVAAGKPVEVVSRELHVVVPTVHKWIKRFAQAGIDGLSDLPRSGQPRRLPKSLRDEILRITREERPPQGDRWTIRAAAGHLGVTQHQIRKVWSEAGLRPHEVSQHTGRKE